MDALRGYIDLDLRLPENRAAWAEYHRRYRARNRERLPTVSGLLVHGTRSTYVNWSCRCGPCTAGNRGRA